MNVLVINGSMRRGSTWHLADAVLQELARCGPLEAESLFLPRDMPQFCTGCFSCFFRGEAACPHAERVRPIVEALERADLIVLTSPVYGFDVSGQMKALLDHLCFMWMSHRPDPALFSKVGLAVTTAAGGGHRRAAGTLKNSLTYWGVKRAYMFAARVGASGWDEVGEKKRAALTRRAQKLAARIARAAGRADRLPNPLFRSFFFGLMARMQKGNTWNKTDRDYWLEKGWLDGKKPF